ncbi:5,6-dimethylbenzimidazole synthase [Cumulibacter manganitolerans]|uniref:5,6-dimethylbenzimidazole synthase n=1 Tax=Cumulibacter manganitolerans TaxID=1884992 RepID=UPI001298182D|nr:5,6-dimethylbenzimidazole synthase [Cumulibacter manganitolerans]
MDVYEAIARRRDVRAEFTGEPVADDVLLRMLAAAHRAPSVGLSSPWDFVVVRDPQRLAAMAQHVAEARQRFADSLPADRRETFDPIKIEGICESGTGVVVSYDHSRGGAHVLGRHTIADTGLLSVALAIENLWLAGVAEGVGVGWVSFYDEDFLAGLVGLPDGVRPVAWLCVGPVHHLEETPDLERFGWRGRRPLEQAIHHETWGSVDAVRPR